MSADNRFENRYKNGDLPWNINRADYNLINVVTNEPIPVGKAIDIGCGTGDNAIWLAKQGFNVTGIDYSKNAIEMAKIKAEDKGANNTHFLFLDILNDKIPDGPYSFVYDRGCFHSFDTNKERKKYAGRTADLLMNGGLWLSLLGSHDDGRLDQGPPKKTVLDIATAVEPYFEIQYIKAGRFDSNDAVPSKIWICLMKKRGGQIK
ncbi:MAG: class I SAM-dependent methyltransferase [Bacteroidales bacterium]|nr:class I SAM-dependent methyltransferase [Bacteroidales bacterium]